MQKQMHLGSLSHGVGSHVAGWRMPGAETEKENFDLVARAVLRSLVGPKKKKA